MTAFKKIDIGTQFDICEPICFKLGVMIYTTELYVFLFVYVTMNLMRGHGMQESKDFYAY